MSEASCSSNSTDIDLDLSLSQDPEREDVLPSQNSVTDPECEDAAVTGRNEHLAKLYCKNYPATSRLATRDCYYAIDSKIQCNHSFINQCTKFGTFYLKHTCDM